MLIGGIALGLILGLIAGGRLEHLVTVKLRWTAILFAALILRFGTELLLDRGIGIVETLRLPLFSVAFGMLLLALWRNRRQPGLSLAFVGTLSNAVAVVVNGGRMPIWLPSLLGAGLSPADASTSFHTLLRTSDLDAGFLLHAGPLADVIPIPLPIIQTVASIGDVFLTAGLAFFLFVTLVRTPADDDLHDLGPADSGDRLIGVAGTTRMPRTLESVLGSRTVRAETGLGPSLAEASMLERPFTLAGAAGAVAPSMAPLPLELEGVPGVAIPRPGVPRVVERARRHPYVRLAINNSFTALWTGQLVSLFGDRLHQIALGLLVLSVTGSPIAVAFAFMAATLPNLLLGPVAGTLVDRWDHREVMIVSDLLRASAVLLVPVMASISIWLVYPLIFIVTCISIFFRPAKTAILPRLVKDDELVTANSATWLGETLADVIGYPLAGLFVGFLGTALPLAFWIDGATYVASAILIATIAVPAMQRRAPVATSEGPHESLVAEMKAGWHFLRNDVVLLANTLQGVAGQFTAGVTLAVTIVYASEAIQRGTLNTATAYAFLETGLGLGNLVGGFVIGLIGARIAKGRLVIVGYAVYGLTVMGLALTGSLPVALAMMFGAGVANMVYIIPSQTLFQERAPADMIGRVVGFRFALVFGAMTLAMGLGGVLTAVIGVQPVLFLFGTITLLAGLAGLLSPAVRDA
jgi:MFS family permease